MVGSSNPSIWGTWEDLLLAYAVRRHGTDCWDSVAAELRHRSSYGHLLNPRCCHLRFNQLHRRFSTGNPFADTLEAPSDVPWLEDLRRLRVAELRRDVQRYDASIMSLQKKVKTLTEEACETPGSGAGDPDRISYRSSKESNMADPDQEARREPDPAADGSCHGSTATEVKESGDAQSSACLTNRWSWRRRKETSPEKELEGGPITVETTKMKSQPLMLFLEMITSDKLCSVFMRKLESQMSEKYEQVIRRHMDLETVREQLLRDHQQGAYITIHMYRDLLLICNNAIVFYTKGSREYSAALHLRHLCRPRHHISMPTLLACGRQRETALEPVTVKVKTKEKAKNKKVARKTKNKKGRRGSSSSSNLTVVKKNKVRSSPSVESEVEKKKKKKSGKQPVRQAKRGATVTKQHIQPVKKRIASSAPASTPPEKRARKSPESKRATAKPPPPPAAAKKPRPRRR